MGLGRGVFFIRMRMTVQITVQRIRETIHTFKLERGVRNVIAVINNLVDAALDLRARADVQIIGENVGGHSA